LNNSFKKKMPLDSTMEATRSNMFEKIT